MIIVHPQLRLPECTIAGAPLYHFGRDNGYTVEVAHGCEHYIRDSYPDDPPPREWLESRIVDPALTAPRQLPAPTSAPTAARRSARPVAGHPVFGNGAWVHDRTGQPWCRDDLGDWERDPAAGGLRMDVAVARPAHPVAS